MMTKTIFSIFFAVHVLGDFYFQSEALAQEKQTRYQAVVKHALLYGGTGLLFLKILLPALPWIYIFVFVLAHGLIDGGKYVSGKREGGTVFVVDQLAHLLTILAITYFVITSGVPVSFNPQLESVFATFGADSSQVLSWTVKSFLLHKPANLLISLILTKYKPEEKSGSDKGAGQSSRDVSKEKNAGRFIGTLERLIMVILITLEQYSAVGLVLTAKSIARYERISKEQAFAEYYLLGTLLSTLYAIVIATTF